MHCRLVPLSQVLCHRTCHLADRESKANGGIAKGHDCSQDGQEPQPVEVWNLAEQQLEGAKDEHERVVVHLRQEESGCHDTSSFCFAMLGSACMRNHVTTCDIHAMRSFHIPGKEAKCSKILPRSHFTSSGAAKSSCKAGSKSQEQMDSNWQHTVLTLKPTQQHAKITKTRYIGDIEIRWPGCIPGRGSWAHRRFH